jgi:hypothetical protein
MPPDDEEEYAPMLVRQGTIQPRPRGEAIRSYKST